MDEGVPEEIVWIIVVMAFIIGSAVGAVLQYESSSPTLEGMGQMICDEKGLGDFVEFDEDSKTVKCEPRLVREQFDGGYVQVVHGGGQ